MRRRELQLMVGVLLAVGTLFFFGSVIGRAAPATGPDSASLPERTDGAIRVNRMITIPYGISSPLLLDANRHVVQVKGHGRCPGEGSVDIHVFVEQETTDARAMAWRRWECPRGEDWQWTAHADAMASQAFAPSGVDVCAITVMRLDDEPAGVVRWCRDDVVLRINWAR